MKDVILHISDADDPFVDVDRPIVYKLRTDVNLPRNFYLKLHDVDQDISFQFIMMLEHNYTRNLRLRDRLIDAAIKEEALHEKRHVYIFFRKESADLFTIYQVSSYAKYFEFYCSRESLPESLTDGWPVIEFDELFELKDEYVGYLTGKNYGI